MNAKGAVIGAVLIVLAVALFAAIYFGTRARDSGDDSLPFTEFTARGTSQPNNDGVTYTSVVYSKLTLDNNNQPTAWTLEAQVDYTDNGVLFRNIYKNGRVYSGVVEANGFFNISFCNYIDQGRLLNDSQGSFSFVPQEITDEGRTASTSRCTDCTIWTLSLSGQNFILEEKDSVPKFVSSRDQVISVSEFTYGKRTWSAPEIDEIYDNLCVGDNTTVNQGGPQSARHAVDRNLIHQSSIFMKDNTVSLTHSDWRESVKQANVRVNKPHALSVKPKLSLMGCPQSWRGDGWCDPVCNDAANNFDNGDCCVGTCTAGRTYPCGARAPYDCKSSGRTCLFLHGVGGKGDGSVRNDNSPSDCSFGRCQYWGNVRAELAGICQNFQFLWSDTNSRGWNNLALQDQYYNLALQVHNSGGLVFAHSMGNLILGGACFTQRKCSVRWINLGGPIRGSKCADWVWIAQKLLGPDSYGAGYSSLKRTVNGLAESSTANGVIAAIQNNNLVRGSACGVAGFGSGGSAGIALGAVKAVIYGLWECDRSFWGICYWWRNVPADGLVHIEECGRWGGWGFSTSTQSRFFEYDGNHNDLTGTGGNYNNFYEWLRWIARQNF